MKWEITDSISQNLTDSDSESAYVYELSCGFELKLPLIMQNYNKYECLCIKSAFLQTLGYDNNFQIHLYLYIKKLLMKRFELSKSIQRFF